MGTSGREPFGRALAAAAVYVIGAAAYFLTVEVLGASFRITPLFFGGVMLAASLFRPRLLASGVLLLSWGVAVLLDDHGVAARGRTGAVYMIAFGAATLVLVWLRRRLNPAIALESAAAVMLLGGLALYAAYDVHHLARAWLWTVVVLVNAAGLAGSALWREHRRPPDP